MDRLGVSSTADKVKDLPCLCHGTSLGGLASILKDSLKPASHLDPAILRFTGRSTPQRQATKGAGKGKGTSDRNVLMMSPYAYFDVRNYVGGARKGSEVYIFLDTDKVGPFLSSTQRRLYLTHRAAVVSCDEWPWTCIEAVLRPGSNPGNGTDLLIFHHFATKATSRWCD